MVNTLVEDTAGTAANALVDNMAGTILAIGNNQGYYGGYNQEHSGERHHSSHERY